MRSLVLPALLVIITGFCAVECGYKLKFHPIYRPPDVFEPDPAKNFWKVAVDNVVTELYNPEWIGIQLVDDVNEQVVLNYTSNFVMQSVSRAYTDNITNGLPGVDPWNGQFCNQEQNYITHRRLQYVKPYTIRYYCSGKAQGFNISQFKMHRGEFFLRAIRYIDESFGDDKRFIRFHVTHEGKTYTLDTPDFETYENFTYVPNKIEFEEDPPTTVVANTPFTVQLKVVNRYNDTITDTIYSRMGVIAAVSNVHKMYENIAGTGEGRLVVTNNTLGGPDVVLDTKKDHAIFGVFDKGLLNVTMRLEDVSDRTYLNFTMRLNQFDYKRFPGREMHSVYQVNCHFQHHRFGHEGNSTHSWYSLPLNTTDYFRAVLMTPIRVTAQTPAQFRIVPGIVTKPVQLLMVPIGDPIQVELLDVNGNRVTSGPDSNLTVTVSSDDEGTCISDDATFSLHRGIGTFKGSVCKEIVGTTSLKFTVTTSAGAMTTQNTGSFEIKNYKRFIVNTRNNIEYFYLEVALHNGWKHFNVDLLVPHNVTTIEEATALLKKGETDQSFKIFGMIAPFDKDFHREFVKLAHAFNVPVLSYSTEIEYGNREVYPLLQRMAFTTKYEYAALCNALNARNWKTLIVIKTIGTIIPADFTEYAHVFEITYRNTFDFPKVASNTTVLSNTVLDSFFEKLLGAKTNVIFSFVSGPGLTYLLAESAKRGIVPANGYTWLGSGGMIDDFPYNNEGQCGQIWPRCTTAFKGTTIFQPYKEPFIPTNSAFLKGALSATMFHIIDPIAYPHESLTGFEDTPEVMYDAFRIYDAACRFMQLTVDSYNNRWTYNSENVQEKWRFYRNSYKILGSMDMYDENDEKMNFTASIFQIDAVGNYTGKDSVLKQKRIILMGDYVTAKNITKDNILKEINIVGETMVYATVPEIEKSTFKFQSINAAMKSTDKTMDDWPIVELERSEKIAPNFYCPGGCGGRLLSTTDRYTWEHGVCVEQGKCRCNTDPMTNNPGYKGLNCETTVCDGCINGNCTSPSHCVCHTGYADTSSSVNDCNRPTCLTHGCVNGQCTSGDFCECDSGFYGIDCSKKCNCGSHGKCNDGNTGTGMCTCDSGYVLSDCSLAVVIPIVAATAGLLIIVVLVYFVLKYHYKKVKTHAELMSTEWKVDWDNIRMRQAHQKSSMKSLVSMLSMMSTKSGKNEEKVVCQNQGLWNGKDVVVKLIRKDTVELTDEIRWEIKQMRDLTHPNLCLFIGACVEAPHVCILQEVCGKGSLEDILSNDSIELSWDFRYSMLKDIIRGMQYLNNSDIRSHGRLKSSNCLVDNRWTVKLSDYGMKSFKGNQFGVRLFSTESGIGIDLPTDDEMEGCDFYNLLWTAPEIVATGVSHPNHVHYGTMQGDVYSFGIIMVEMCTRHHPFHEIDHIGPDKIVQMVGRLISYDEHVTLVECLDAENIGVKVLRPQLNDDELPSEAVQAQALRQTIEDCWNQDPLCRPTFVQLMQKLSEISPHRGELMDNLIVLMEQYTNNLETIVSERTFDVKLEKEKGDLLLSKMLPPLIAEELKSGTNPKPEYFNCVTIYFSDVVGFGKMCAEASPYQVVELLNELYSVMDDVIDSFDCYKVETIGDCYMVVSGLPVRNGDNHAGEIASMALQLLTAFYGVGYSHLHGSQVQLRIGIHSGPCVAGVVGLKMPRYCLFGDTVNTSSRMESGGFALRIHLSEDTYNILQRLGGYQFECRGERQVKGRGAMTTYWLTGKDGADYRLPTAEMALSESQHDFK